MPTRDPKALFLIRHESALAGCPPPWPLADLEPLTDPRSWLLPRGFPEAQAGTMRPRQRTPNLAWEGGPSRTSISADSWALLCLCCAHAGHCLGCLPPSSPSSPPCPPHPSLFSALLWPTFSVLSLGGGQGLLPAPFGGQGWAGSHPSHMLPLVSVVAQRVGGMGGEEADLEDRPRASHQSATFLACDQQSQQ